MKATQVLPPNYHLSGKFNLKNARQVISMNLVGFVLLILSIWFFGWLAIRMRGTSAISFSFEFSSISSSLFSVGKLILVIFLILVLHEAIHAIYFWVFSRHKPLVGFKGFYAYASMPGWYFPRNQYLLIGIAPLVIISLLGIICLAILPIASIYLVLVALVMNTSGAVGDIFVVLWLFTKPQSTMALDKIDSIEFYVPDTREPIR
jgi:hypothetical protein